MSKFFGFLNKQIQLAEVINNKVPTVFPESFQIENKS